jgi:2-dehydropantoate 2-reductase
LMSESDKENKIGRMVIYGAGAIGGVVGGKLALAGNDVVLIGRQGHMNAIREKGLRFVTPGGVHILHIPAFTSPAEARVGPDDKVLLCMKGQNTEEALRNLKKVVRDVPIFCLQNGVRNEETASRYFPRVYGVFVQVGGEYLHDGEVICRREPPGWLAIGCYPRGKDELAEQVGDRLRRAGFYVLATADVMPFKWGKLWINLGNALNAITNARFGENRLVMEAVHREAGEILSEAGISWMSREQMIKEWPDIAAKPSGTVESTGGSSTWQSLTRRQGTVETEFLNGEIVRVAKRLGKKAPINEAIVGIIGEMAAKGEPPGKYSQEELAKLLGVG